jgi:hypothetical protein
MDELAELEQAFADQPSIADVLQLRPAIEHLRAGGLELTGLLVRTEEGNLACFHLDRADDWLAAGMDPREVIDG